MFGGRFSSSVGLVGIDFGTRAVKLVQVREQGGQLNVVGAGCVALPSEDSDSPTELTDKLRAAITSGGFTGRRCVISLPRRDVHMQAVRLPSMPPEELAQAVAWEASQRLDIDRAAMEVDYIATGAAPQGGETREEVLLIAASHAAISPRIDAVTAAGLRPIAIDVHSSAIARVFSRHYRRESDRQVVRVVLDVGASGSTVLILRGDQIAFCKSLHIGGEQFDQAVSQHLQMRPEPAAELREARLRRVVNDGGAIEPSTDRAVYEAVRPLLGELAKEVTLCLRYYGVTFRGHPPERIILCGGDSLEPHFDDLLSQACKLPVDFDDNLNTLDGVISQIGASLQVDPGAKSRWATAVGLSLRDLVSARLRDEITRHASRGTAA